MNQIIKNTIILFVITLVAGICLGTVHDITLDPIAQAQEAAATKTYQEVYPDAASFDEPQELADAVTAAADSIICLLVDKRFSNFYNIVQHSVG